MDLTGSKQSPGSSDVWLAKGNREGDRELTQAVNVRDHTTVQNCGSLVQWHLNALHGEPFTKQAAVKQGPARTPGSTAHHHLDLQR